MITATSDNPQVYNESSTPPPLPFFWAGLWSHLVQHAVRAASSIDQFRVAQESVPIGVAGHNKSKLEEWREVYASQAGSFGPVSSSSQALHLASKGLK